MTDKQAFDSSILPPATSIRSAARRIQQADIKILLVCDDERRLLGTLTDGDIRRAVSESFDLDASVETVMNRSPKVARVHESSHVVRARMRSLVVRHMPRVDEGGRLVGMVLLDETYNLRERNSAVVVMAGGRGLRLAPLTEGTPKPLLKIGTKPVIERQIEMLIARGFRRFYVSVNYLGHMIEEFLGDGSRYGVEIAYLREDSPRGTCGSLSLLERQTQPLVVINGDILTKADFGAMLDFFHETETLATMGVREHDYTVPYGCVKMNGDRIISLEEKPTFRHLINAGIYVLAPEAIEHVPAGRHFDMPDLFETLIGAGMRTNSFLISQEWIDIGRPEDLSWAQKLFELEDRFE